MKKLQNGFTTPEQSKRLLELGAPEDSADCIYYGYGLSPDVLGKIGNNLVYYSEVRNNNTLPCWSVGRLIEIILIAFKKYYFAPKELLITLDTLNRSLLEDAISKIEELKEVYDIDFSKLEE